MIRLLRGPSSWQLRYRANRASRASRASRANRASQRRGQLLLRAPRAHPLALWPVWPAWPTWPIWPIWPINSANSASTTNTALERSAHPLRDSFIYDSGADGHICNDINRFDQSTLRWLESPQPWLGVAGTIETLAYGTVSIYPELANSQQKGQFHLYNCAYAPLSTINLVSAKRLRKVGIVWSTNSDTVEYKGTELFKLTEAYGQYLLEYQEASTASFVATRPLIKPVDARTWHLRMGHLGPEALERLVEATTDAKIQAPHTIDCEDCSRAKATNVVNKGARRLAPRPFYRVHFDLFQHNVSYNGLKYSLVFNDEYTATYYWYGLPDKNQSELLRATRHLKAWTKKQYKLDILQFHTDNDRGFGSDWQCWIEDEELTTARRPLTPRNPTAGPRELGGWSNSRQLQCDWEPYCLRSSGQRSGKQRYIYTTDPHGDIPTHRILAGILAGIRG